MSKKICKIIIIVMVIVAIIIGIMYLIDMNRMKNNKKVIFSTWWYSYTPPVEPENQTIERQKISDAKLKADGTDVTSLIRFNGILYGRSYAVIDYAGDFNNIIGAIDFVIDKEYVPLLDGETNQEEFLHSTVLEANERNLVLNCNDTAILFNAIVDGVNNNQNE